MSENICVEFFELVLKTGYKRKKKDGRLPTIDYVGVWDAFTALANHGQLKKQYPYKNGNFAYSIEYLNISSDKMEIVFGHYDGIAPDRTLRNKNTKSDIVQKRGDDEYVKYLSHCIIEKKDNHLLSIIKVERVGGLSISKIENCLRKAFLDLFEAKPDIEGVFQVTSPNGANSSVDSFILRPKFEPIKGSMLEEAISEGRLKRLKLKGVKFTGFDSVDNEIQSMSGELTFSVLPKDDSEDAKGYLQRMLIAIKAQKSDLEEVDTFVVIQQQDDLSKEQIVEVSEDDDLQIAFVKRRYFKATEARAIQSDNMAINQEFLNKIKRLS